MSSLFEFYGLTRSQNPEDNTSAYPETSRKRAAEDAEKGLVLNAIHIVNLMLTIYGG